MDTNAKHMAQEKLTKLKMQGADVNTYITKFAKYTRRVHYDLDQGPTLEWFKKGIPFKLTERCITLDRPYNWATWTMAVRA